MLSAVVIGLAIVAGAFGQYKWDPSGQYRLVPTIPSGNIWSPWNVRVEDSLRIDDGLWRPNFYDSRLISSPTPLLEPWRSVVVDTIPAEIKEVVYKKPEVKVVEKIPIDKVDGMIYKSLLKL